MAAVTAAALLLGGCGGDPDSEEAAASDAARARPGTAVTPARYRTDLTAVPFSDPEAAVYLRFGQEVTGSAVHRRYAGWRLDAPGASRVLTIRDSLPAPRAAWRILPGPGLRVVAGDGEEPVSLVMTGEGVSWEISVDSTLAEWPGPTGQRERMALGRISTDSIRPALMVLRREARPLDAPPSRARSHLFLLVDGAGRALVVQARRSDAPGAAADAGGERGLEASVRLRRGGGIRRVDGARLLPADTAAEPTAWDLVDPAGEALARLEIDPARVEVRGAGSSRGDSSPSAGTGQAEGSITIRLAPVRGALRSSAGDTLRGLHVDLRGEG